MQRDEIRNQILVLLMKGLMYHSLVCVIYNTASEKTLKMDLQLLILYIPLFYYALVRRKSGKFLVFMLLHAVPCGIFILVLPGLEERIAVGGCTIFMAAASIRIRLRDGDAEEECPPISSLVLFFVTYLAAAQNNRMHVTQICYYEVFLFLILFMAYKNLASTTIFLKLNERIENLPVKQMKGISRMLLGIFIFFLVAGMLLMPYLPVSSLFDAAGQILRVLLLGILRLILWLFTRDVSHIDFFEEGAEEMMPSAEAGEASMIAKLFEWVFITAIYVLLIAGAVYLLVRILYEVYRRFYNKNQNTADESEFIWENPVVKIRAEKGQKRQLFAGGGTNQRIRHLYKKSIRRQFHRKKDIPVALTPTELENLIAGKDARDSNQIDQITLEDENRKKKIALYQKARYSQHECEKQELEAMKHILKTGER